MRQAGDWSHKDSTIFNGIGIYWNHRTEENAREQLLSMKKHISKRKQQATGSSLPGACFKPGLCMHNPGPWPPGTRTKKYGIPFPRVRRCSNHVSTSDSYTYAVHRHIQRSSDTKGTKGTDTFVVLFMVQSNRPVKHSPSCTHVPLPCNDDTDLATARAIRMFLVSSGSKIGPSFQSLQVQTNPVKPVLLHPGVVFL